jgi:hypothetical protein
MTFYTLIVYSTSSHQPTHLSSYVVKSTGNSSHILKVEREERRIKYMKQTFEKISLETQTFYFSFTKYIVKFYISFDLEAFSFVVIVVIIIVIVENRSHPDIKNVTFLVN